MRNDEREASSPSIFGGLRGLFGSGAHRGSLTSLGVREAVTLEAVVSRVIPSDETPGAKEAGVVEYIGGRLSLGKPLDRLEYKTGLATLDKISKAKYGGRFAQLMAKDQDRLLDELERGDAPGWPDFQTFFAKLRQHAVEGFLCDPKYGGNKDYVGWKLVGCLGEPEPEGYAREEILDAREVPPFHVRREGKTHG